MVTFTTSPKSGVDLDGKLRRMIPWLVVAVMALVSLDVAGATDNWPQFRGPNAGVAADDPALPDTWSETENVVWKTPIPGMGWSSPVVWGDHVFLTSAISAGKEAAPVKGLYDPGDEHGKTKAAADHRWVVYDIDFNTGKIRWTRELQVGTPPVLRHLKNSFASETPVTDGERVYVYFGSIGLLAALDMNGKTVWTKELGAYNGPQEFAPAASPILHNDRVYVVSDNTTESFLAAFDRKTGREIWRVQREEVENWATPAIWENDLRTEIVTNGRRKVRSYDLDGKLLWEFAGMTVNVVPTPFSKHGLLYLSSGLPGGRSAPCTPSGPARPATSRLNPAKPATSTSPGSSPCLAPIRRPRSSTATTTTRCSTGGSCSATTRGPASRCTAGSASRPRPRPSPPRRGRTTARCSS